MTVRLTVNTVPPGRLTNAYPEYPICVLTVESASVVETSDRDRNDRSTLTPRPAPCATSGGSGSVVDSVLTLAPARAPDATMVVVLRHRPVLVRMSSSMSRRTVDTSWTNPMSAALAASTAEFDAVSAVSYTHLTLPTICSV